MKKRIALIVMASIAAVFSACSSDNGLKKIRLNEVAHSIFYAPQYVAMEKGFFAEEGLEIDLSLGNGADKTMTAVISGDADIGLCGTEAGIYVYNEGRENHSVAFAQLTQRAGNLLVSREANDDFTWNDVVGKTIIGGRAGGMPQMVLEYILRQNAIDPLTDVEILTNIQYASTAGAFTGGVGDFTVEFDPAAYALEQAGIGSVVASLGADSGSIPYTVYWATQDYIAKNPEIIQSFTNAIQKGMTWVAEHSAQEVAEAIHGYFKENTVEEVAFMFERYKSFDTWKESCVFTEDGFILLQDIMEQGGELSKRIEYDALITTRFAENAFDMTGKK
ncbi:MAG: ABC transporter substrate-binding protein [Clostridiales bacterium]|jgi:NitT/TauT family transport system substrate-binding protein|nr:ABC transporter substrate-binding protein [Clostridiales bacterium]